jgi:tetratricopeptide (TPR) repeat protein
MLAPSLFAVLLCFTSGVAMALDLNTLWDFGQPEVSEQRFRAALLTATGDEALILRTQIARTYGLRRDFDGARRLLKEIEGNISPTGPEAQIRYHLELGRTFASATHPRNLLTSEAQERARAEYERALALARAAKLDGLTIDVIHMLAFVDQSPADQLKWGEAALAVVLSSTQPDAKRWEASVRNNVGYALHQMGRFSEALGQFQEALAMRERGTYPQATRVARWMVAWTLRSLRRNDEALEMQLSLEREADAAGQPDPYVFEELEALYREKGDLSKAQHYAARRAAASGR